jgi:hypothetical protein
VPFCDKYFCEHYIVDWYWYHHASGVTAVWCRKFWGEIDDGDLDDEESDFVKRRGKWKVYERENFSNSWWFNFFERRDISDITSRDGKLFWNRFTVPYQLFIQLLTFAESWFPQHEYDCCKKKVPSVNQLQPQRPMNSS